MNKLTILILVLLSRCEFSGKGFTSEEYTERGVIRTEKGDFKGSIAEFDKAIQLDSTNSSAFYFRGSAKMELRDLEGALVDFNKSINISPKSYFCYHNRGIVKIALGDKKGGCLDWTKAGELGYKDAYTNIKKFCK
jgi:tetratricopeptide (TPR) repeat protein